MIFVARPRCHLDPEVSVVCTTCDHPEQLLVNVSTP